MENTVHYILIAIGLLVFLAAILFVIQVSAKNSKMTQSKKDKKLRG
ncbi:MAG: hypothetical protein AAF717_04065 [Bacteroidota bacterium]